MSTVIPVPAIRAEPSPPKRNPFHVLSVGRGVPKKGYPILNEAIKQLTTPVQWTIVGADLAFVGDVTHSIRALGSTSFGRIEAIYAGGVDVFALACCVAEDGDTDGVPVAILEAMARGVAVVATTVGGIPELISSGENGLLVPPNDPDAFAAALSRLEQDPVLCARIAENGRTHVRSMRSVDAQVRSLVTLFDAVRRRHDTDR